MAVLTLRFDLRVPPFATTTHLEQHAACLEMSQWADDHGFLTAVLSEHHGVEDGFTPAPLTLAAAILARTRSLMVNVAALLVPLNDPVRIAEQLVVLDLLAPGRIGIVAGLGYRHDEFEMAGQPYNRRGRIVDEYLDVMLKAFTGEPFEWQGRTIRVTPTPATKPHPLVLVGGASEIGARRAARHHLPFMPSIGDPALADVYRAACAEEGYEGGWVILPSGPGFVHVTDDPEKAWAEIGPHALYDAQTYSSWQTPGQRSQVHVHAPQTVDDVRASGVYRIVTPEECIELMRDLGRSGGLVLHPLMGGMPPELGWQSLELLASHVLPRL